MYPIYGNCIYLTIHSSDRPRSSRAFRAESKACWRLSVWGCDAPIAPLEPLKRPVADDPSLAEAVDALKKGQNVRLPGLLDERIEDCGPNRNCFAAVKRERNASKPPLEEFLSRFLGT